MKIGTILGFAAGSVLSIVTMHELEKNNSKSSKEFIKEKLKKILD